MSALGIAVYLALLLTIAGIGISWAWRAAPGQVRRRLQKDLERAHVEPSPEIMTMLEVRLTHQMRWFNIAGIPLAATFGILFNSAPGRPHVGFIVAVVYASFLMLPGLASLASMVVSSRRAAADRRVATTRRRDVLTYVPRFDLLLGRAFTGILISASTASFLLVALGHRHRITVALTVVTLLGVVVVSVTYAAERHILTLPSRAETDEEMAVNELLLGRAVRACEATSILFVLAAGSLTAYYLLLPPDYFESADVIFPPEVILLLLVAGALMFAFTAHTRVVDRSRLCSLTSDATHERRVARDAR